MNRLRTGVAGAALGVAGLVAARFLLVPAHHAPHYHANFAIFVDGTRLDLSGDRYMEEVSACTTGEEVLPRSRAHLHGNDPDVAHVHHDGVTWGHLLANLNLGLGDDYLALDGGPVLTEGAGKTLKLVLNGQPQFAVDGELIRSGDRLLISYGAESEEEVARTQFAAVASNAEEFNQRDDPAACAGAHEAGFWERMRHAVAG
jgi:hypothetical protein